MTMRIFGVWLDNNNFFVPGASWWREEPVRRQARCGSHQKREMHKRPSNISQRTTEKNVDTAIAPKKLYYILFLHWNSTNVSLTNPTLPSSYSLFHLQMSS